MGEEEGEEEGEEARGGGGGDEVPSAYRGGMNARLEQMRQRGVSERRGKRGAGRHAPREERAASLPADGLQPRTKTAIMAVAFAIGIYRIWATLGPAWKLYAAGANPAAAPPEDPFDEGM